MKEVLKKYWIIGLVGVAAIIFFIWKMPWIDNHQGSLMVIVTVIYVLATLAILCANSQSVEASNKQIEEARKQVELMSQQLKESKRQYDESKRLDCAPFLQTILSSCLYADPILTIKLKARHISRGNNLKMKFWLRNIGNGAATSVKYECKSDYYEDCFGYILNNAIGKEDKADFIMDITSDNENPFDGSVVLTWEYNDVLGNTYSQETIIQLERSSVISCETKVPLFRKVCDYSGSKDPVIALEESGPSVI